MILAVLCAIAGVRAADAQTPAGTVGIVVGQAAIQRAGAAIAAVRGTPVFEDDRISTGPDSSVIIVLKDRSQLELGESASISIDQFMGGGAAPTRVGLFSGVLRSIVRKIRGAPANYEVHTPNAVAAVRGTDFYAVYTNESAELGALPGCDRYTEVVVREGEVNLAQSSAPNGGIDLEPGHDATVPCNRPPVETTGCSTRSPGLAEEPSAGSLSAGAGSAGAGSSVAAADVTAASSDCEALLAASVKACEEFSRTRAVGRANTAYQAYREAGCEKPSYVEPEPGIIGVSPGPVIEAGDGLEAPCCTFLLEASLKARNEALRPGSTKAVRDRASAAEEAFRKAGCTSPLNALQP